MDRKVSTSGQAQATRQDPLTPANLPGTQAPDHRPAQTCVFARSPGAGKLLKPTHGWRSLVGYSLQCCKEVYMTEETEHAWWGHSSLKFRGLDGKGLWSFEAADLTIIGLTFAALCLSTLGRTSKFFG